MRLVPKVLPTANRFADHVEVVISEAPDPVKWIALDYAAIPDVAYSASVTLANLMDYSRVHHARFVLVHPDSQLLGTLHAYGTMDRMGVDNVFPTLAGVFDAYLAGPGVAVAGQVGR